MAKKTAAASLLGDVSALLAAQSVRTTWLDRLPPDGRAELLAMRMQFLAGEMGDVKRHTLARCIRSAALDRGWPIPGAKGLSAWLSEDR